MHYTRRDVGKLALAALPAASLLAKPNSRFGGVQIGINAPYSFRGAANSAEEVLDAMVDLGLSAVELRSQPVEIYLGAPSVPRAGRNATAEQRAAQSAAADALRKWRLSASLDGFKAFRKKYEDAGVNIDIVKFDGVQDMTDDELDYMFQISRALGARFITCEPPRSATKRIAPFATKHRLMVGYHGHANVTGPEAFGSPQSWEEVMSYSNYHGANVDIGHFIAGNGFSPAEFIKQHHNRITNLHIKDRKRDEGPNMPWGQGDTPIREILQLMKRVKYDFMATIEMEHPVPEGSNTMAELAKCIQFCKDALA
jgi:sugar phosphate isomerase/epimerase